MTEAERDAALVAFIHNFPNVARTVESSARQIEDVARSQKTLDAKVDGVVRSQRALDGKVDGLVRVQEAHGQLMTTLNADQARLGAEVRGKIAALKADVRGKLEGVIDEDAVTEIVTDAVSGAQRAIEVEAAAKKIAEEAAQAKTRLAQIEAAEKKKADDAAKVAGEIERDRRVFRYTLISGLIVGVVMMAFTFLLGRASRTPSASAATPTATAATTTKGDP